MSFRKVVLGLALGLVNVAVMGQSTQIPTVARAGNDLVFTGLGVCPSNG